MPTITAHHYVLAVPNAQQTADFFVSKLGFKCAAVNDEGWRFVERDGFLVMLGTCPDAIHPKQLGDHSYFAHFVVDDVDAYFQEIRQQEVSVLSQPADKPWGMREFGLTTPDGHRIMVGQRISGIT